MSYVCVCVTEGYNGDGCDLGVLTMLKPGAPPYRCLNPKICGLMSHMGMKRIHK